MVVPDGEGPTVMAVGSVISEITPKLVSYLSLTEKNYGGGVQKSY